MLEHVEVAVASLNALEKSSTMPSVFMRYDRINTVIATLQSNWSPGELPVDLKRLATGILETVECVTQKGPEKVAELLSQGMARYGGSHNVDWSPYRAILEYLADDDPKLLRLYLTGKVRNRKLYVYEEVLGKIGVDRENARNAIG